MDSKNLTFLEKYAFSNDRYSVLADLLPGSDEYHFYSGLLALQVNRLEEAKLILAQWKVSRNSDSGSLRKNFKEEYEELEKRVWLARWDAGEEKEIAALLKKRLKLEFQHGPSRFGGSPTVFGSVPADTNRHSSFLPVEVTSMDSLFEYHFKDRQSLLSEFIFSWAAKRHPECIPLLAKEMTWPSIPNLVEILPDIFMKGGVSQVKANLLTLEQLQIIESPEVWKQQWFFDEYCKRLLPPADIDITQDDIAFEKNVTLYIYDWSYNKKHDTLLTSDLQDLIFLLERADFDSEKPVDVELNQRWLGKLQPLADHNLTLRAKILYARMELALRREEIDSRLLFDYLQIPKSRPGSYVKQERNFGNSETARMDSLLPDKFGPFLPQIDDDTSFVRDYFLCIFSKVSVTAEIAQSFVLSPSDECPELSLWLPLLKSGFLRLDFMAQCLAEAKLVLGEGDHEIWLEILEHFESTSCSRQKLGETLRSRIDIDFAHSNPQFWKADETVFLDVFIKNVPQLTVKVFDIDLLHYFRDKEVNQVDLKIDLDGLTPRYEKVIQTNVHNNDNNLLPPVRRVRHRLQFPHLDGKRGCFIVELIGNGRSSRAIIHKGQLRCRQRRSVAGHALRILREDGSLVRKNAYVWVDGKEYRQEDNGEFVIPFATTNDESKRILLTEGDLTSVDTFHQREETYSMIGKFWLDEWSLVPGEEAKLLINVTLLLDGGEIPLSLLERPSLHIKWVNHDGIETVQTIKSLHLRSDEEFVYNLRVRNKTQRLEISLFGVVKQVSKGGIEQKLTASKKWEFPNPHAQLSIAGLFLVPTREGYFLRVLGLAGEPKPGVVVSVKLRAWFVINGFSKNVDLVSDENGTVNLGKLNGIIELVATTEELTGSPLEKSWKLEEMTANSWKPDILQGTSGNGNVLRIPYNPLLFFWPGGNEVSQNNCKGVALFELNQGGYYVGNVTKNHVRFNEGYLELTNLPPGDFSLYLPGRENPVSIHIVEPLVSESFITSQLSQDNNSTVEKNDKNWAVENEDKELVDFIYGKTRMGNLSERFPLVIQRVEEINTECEDTGIKYTEMKDVGNTEKLNGLVIKLLGSNPETTRVHVWLSHMVGPPPVLSDIPGSKTTEEKPFLTPTGKLKSHYLTGRILSDEVRYVLDRREVKRGRTGNMLSRPSLLLHPWARKSTTNSRQEVSLGTPFSGNIENVPLYGSSSFGGNSNRMLHEMSTFSFLPDQNTCPNIWPLFPPATVLLANLRPDESGDVFIPKSLIPISHTLARIVVVDNSKGSVFASREYSLSGLNLDFSSISKDYFKTVALTRGLSSDKHYCQQRSIAVVTKGEVVDIADKTTAQLQFYDSVEKVFTLMESLLKDEDERIKWREFSFVTTWSQLNENNKQEMLKKFGCHELHLFLLFKDTAFFEKYVLPALRTKMDRSFIDDWLLCDDEAVISWAFRHQKEGYGLLNAVERCLLVWKLMKFGFRSEAETVVTEEVHLATNNNSIIDQNRLFEVSLGGGMLHETPGEENDENDDVIQERSLFAGFVNKSFGVSTQSMASLDQPQRMMMPRAARAMPAFGKMRSTNFMASNVQDLQLRGKIEQRYRNTDITKVYVETHYFEQPLEDMSDHTIPPNAFWADFSRHILHDAIHDPTFLQKQKFPKPFLSEKLAEAGGGYTGSMLALAVLDLPFSTPISGATENGKEGLENVNLFGNDHVIKYFGSRMTFSPSWPLILFSQRIEESPPPSGTFQPPLAVQHLLFESTDINNGDLKLLAHGETLQVGKCYGFRAFVINLCSEAQNLMVLLQIPEGSVPVSPIGTPTLAVPITVDPYSTGNTDIHFYFPETGKFKQFPAHVSRTTADKEETEKEKDKGGFSEGLLLAVAQGVKPYVEVISQEEMRRRIVKEREEKGWGKGVEVWKDLSQQGSSEAVLEYIADKQINIRETDFLYILWRLKDFSFFKSLTDILRRRFIYDDGVWSYSLYHQDIKTMEEYVPKCLTPFFTVPIVESKLLKLETGASSSYMYWMTSLSSLPRTPFISTKNPYEYREFTPLVNARTHTIQGAKPGASGILNFDLEKQYSSFLAVCSRRKSVEGVSAIQATYYLLLQERIEDAQKMFEKVSFNGPIDEQLQVQIDYMKAYFDMHTSSFPVPKIAKEISLKYKDCQVIEWREKFTELAKQLNEIERASTPDTSIEAQEGEALSTRDDTATETTDSEVKPSGKSSMNESKVLELCQDSGELWVNYANISSFQVSFYVMDIELMFSANPFVQKQTGAFAYVFPNRTFEFADLKNKSGRTESLGVEIPEEYLAKNLFVEVSGNGIRRTTMRYSDAGLLVEISENRGQLRVMRKKVSTKSKIQNQSQNQIQNHADDCPVQSAYVKVYSRFHDGSVNFYKDGYTDRRGRFDYVAISTDELPKVAMFSILVISDEYGAVIREAVPPTL